jgi:hypothetical protein
MVMPAIRPAPQLDPSGYPDIYAIRDRDRCMSPVIADGAVIAASKLETPKPGDYVVLWFRPELVPPGESPLQIKRLVANAEPWLLIQRFVPSGFFSVDPSELLAVHKAIGLFPVSKPGSSHDFKSLIPFASLRTA